MYQRCGCGELCWARRCLYRPVDWVQCHLLRRPGLHPHPRLQGVLRGEVTSQVEIIFTRPSSHHFRGVEPATCVAGGELCLNLQEGYQADCCSGLDCTPGFGGHGYCIEGEGRGWSGDLTTRAKMCHVPRYGQHLCGWRVPVPLW